MKKKLLAAVLALSFVFGVGCAVLIDEQDIQETIDFEEKDWSGLVPKRDIIDLEQTGRARAGNHAVEMFVLRHAGGIFNHGWIVPGMIITVFFSGYDAPELRLFLDHDGYAPGVRGYFHVAPFAVNESHTAVQFGFRELWAAFGENFDILDALMIAATRSEITVDKVLVGRAE